MGVPHWLRMIIRRPADELWAIGERAAAELRARRSPGLAAVTGVFCLAGYYLYGAPALRPSALALGGVSADLPLRVELARLPGSAFLPTPQLPLPLAMLQLLVVLGAAELVLGTRATAAVALTGHVTSTLLARLFVSAAGAGLFGVPLGQAGILDTGPSAMTTAAGTWLLLRCRAYTTMGMLGAALTISALVQDNLDGHEHLAAFTFGALAAVVPGRAHRLVAAAAARSRPAWWVPHLPAPAAQPHKEHA